MTKSKDLILKNKDKVLDYYDKGKKGAEIYRLCDFTEEMSYPTFLSHLKMIKNDSVPSAITVKSLQKQVTYLEEKLKKIKTCGYKNSHNFLDYVGNTPVVAVPRLTSYLGIHASIYMKLEFFNPSGSVKDRIFEGMLEDAENKGLIQPDRTLLIEPTSGNAGVALATIAAAKGYHLIITMPHGASIERRKMLHLLGAHVELTKTSEGMNGAIRRAHELHKQYSSSFILNQFENHVNPYIHALTTGKEIWEQFSHHVDTVVVGIGTGGGITGIAQYLKSKNSNIHVVGIEPRKSPVINGGEPHAHQIQGIGAGFIPKVLDTKILDEVLSIRESDAYRTARLCARMDGIAVGISSGATLYGAITYAQRKANEGKIIIVMAPDGAERYLSTDLFKGY